MLKTIFKFVWQVISIYVASTMFVLSFDFWIYENDTARKILIFAVVIAALSHFGKAKKKIAN